MQTHIYTNNAQQILQVSHSFFRSLILIKFPVPLLLRGRLIIRCQSGDEPDERVMWSGLWTQFRNLLRNNVKAIELMQLDIPLRLMHWVYPESRELRAC